MSTTVELHRLATPKPAKDCTTSRSEKNKIRVVLLILQTLFKSHSPFSTYWTIYGLERGKTHFYFKVKKKNEEINFNLKYAILAVTPQMEMYIFALSIFQVWKQYFLKLNKCILWSWVLRWVAFQFSFWNIVSSNLNIPQVNQVWVQCSKLYHLIMLAGRMMMCQE